MKLNNGKGNLQICFKTLLKKLNFESTSDINGNYGPQTTQMLVSVAENIRACS